MATVPPFATREEWLKAAESIMRGWIEVEGYTYPSNTRVALGFPRKGKGRGDPIGQCFSKVVSGDEHFEIFVSPVHDNGQSAAETLLHEMVHVAVGLEHGHKKPFAKLAAKLGFNPPWTTTPADADLVKLLQEKVVDALGPLPHAAMNLSKGGKTVPTAKTYLIKLTCPDCDYPAYTTRKWLSSDGAPYCPCGERLVERS
jgi:hypothetical protein